MEQSLLYILKVSFRSVADNRTETGTEDINGFVGIVNHEKHGKRGIGIIRVQLVGAFRVFRSYEVSENIYLRNSSFSLFKLISIGSLLRERF